MAGRSARVKCREISEELAMAGVLVFALATRDARGAEEENQPALAAVQRPPVTSKAAAAAGQKRRNREAGGVVIGPVERACRQAAPGRVAASGGGTAAVA